MTQRVKEEALEAQSAAKVVEVPTSSPEEQTVQVQQETQKEQTKSSNKRKTFEENQTTLNKMKVIIDLFRIKYKCLLSFFNVFFSQIR